MPFYCDDRTYLELDILYTECAKPIDERCLPMVQQKDEGAVAVYWRRLELKA